MSKNTLYQFLIGFESQVQEQGVKIEYDINRKGIVYIRIPFTISDVLCISDLRLKNHHLSIYSNEDNANPFLSQYHYTCIIEDNQGFTWRSHIFLMNETLWFIVIMYGLGSQ